MAKSKVKPTRRLLTWAEIRDMEASWKNDDGPGGDDVRKLVKHLLLFEHLHGIVLDENIRLKKELKESRDLYEANHG
jgi:hypothetical protein